MIYQIYANRNNYFAVKKNTFYNKLVPFNML